MSWFFIAFLAPFLWAVVNVADKFLVAKFSEKEKERSSGGLVLFSSLIGIFIAGLIGIFIPDVFSINFFDALLLFSTGILTIVWIVLYLFTLETEDISSVAPLFLTVPIFGYILGYFFLGESFNLHQIIGSFIILLGVSLISFDFSKGSKKFKIKPLIYMLTACCLVAISGVVFKYVTAGGDFWVSSFWEYVGLGISGLFIFLFIPRYRLQFLHMNRTGGKKIFLINVISELMTVSGNLLTNFALLLAPVTMVYLVGSFQPAIVLFLTILCTKFFPHIAKENLSLRVLVPKIVAIIITIFGSLFLFM